MEVNLNFYRTMWNPKRIEEALTVVKEKLMSKSVLEKFEELMTRSDINFLQILRSKLKEGGSNEYSQ